MNLNNIPPHVHKFLSKNSKYFGCYNGWFGTYDFFNGITYTYETYERGLTVFGKYGKRRELEYDRYIQHVLPTPFYLTSNHKFGVDVTTITKFRPMEDWMYVTVGKREYILPEVKYVYRALSPSGWCGKPRLTIRITDQYLVGSWFNKQLSVFLPIV